MNCDCLRCGVCASRLYEANCEKLMVQPDPSIWAGLRCDSQILVATNESVNLSLLALFKLVSNKTFSFPASVSLGNEITPLPCASGDWLCSLFKLRIESIGAIVNLNLSNLGLTGMGMRDLAACSTALSKLKYLDLKSNFLVVCNGSRYAAEFLVTSSQHLRVFDVSYNGLHSDDVNCIRLAAQCKPKTDVLVIAEESVFNEDWRSFAIAEDTRISHFDKIDEDDRVLRVVVLGNFPTIELWNAISHGFGVILSCIGLYDLLSLTRNLSASIQLACLIYGLSGLTLFTASTLYHSFFLLTTAKKVLKIIDHCAVFILIAGSYTPICAILYSLKAERLAEWAMCFFGIWLHTFSLNWPSWSSSSAYAFLETCIYVSMGWLVVVAFEHLAESFSADANIELFKGGMLYMVGLIFFIWDSTKVFPAMHAVWHFFVLAAAATQYMAIRSVLEKL